MHSLEWIEAQGRNDDLGSVTDARREYLEFLYALYPELNEESSQEEEIGYFEAHNQKVAAFAEQNGAFAKRLLLWQASDGWESLWDSLDLPVPQVPFPHSNRRDEYHGY